MISITTRAAAVVGMLATATATATAAQLSPQDFAYGSAVVITKQSAAYRAPLPLAVYQGTVDAGLADFRVFNARGDTVPYSISRPAEAKALVVAVVLPLFPLPGGGRSVIDGLRLSIDTPGAAVHWQAQTSRQSSAVTQYILDGRSVSQPVGALLLHWAESDADYSGQMRVEVSEDLGTWQTVMTAAPVVNLRADGRSIVQNRISITPIKTRFWRLSWLGSAPGMKLDSVSAESDTSPSPVVRERLDVAATQDPAHPTDYFFDVGAHVPVDRLGVLLTEVNTLADVTFDSRSRQDAAWLTVTRATFSHLVTAQGDQQTAAVPVTVDRHRYWRVRVQSGGSQTPASIRLHVEWVPDEVTFLARGDGPYRLAYGSSTVPAAETNLTQLPAQGVIEQAATGPREEVGGSSRLERRVTPFNRMRLALWGVLLLAVAGLAWMAYQLISESRSSNS